MESVNKIAQDVTGNKLLVCIYFAVLIVIVLIILYKSMSDKSENIIGKPVPDTVQSILGGPDLRFASQLSATNMGRNPVYVQDVKRMYPNAENMTADREPPVFYDISQTLGEYQYATQFNCKDGSTPMPITDAFGNVTYQCDDSSTPTRAEYMSSNPASTVQEALLRNKLF